MPDSNANTKSCETPYCITRKSSGEVVYLVALYKYHKNLDLYTFSIITSDTPENMSWFHSKKPCILELNTMVWNSWVENSERLNLSQEEISKILKQSFDEKKYVWYEVSKDVGKMAIRGHI